MAVSPVSYTHLDEKLLEMIYTRLDAVKEVVYRNGTLRAYFFRDIWRVEKVRKKFDAKEMCIRDRYKDEKDPHFNTEAQLLLGKRYAKKVLKFYKHQ